MMASRHAAIATFADRGAWTLPRPLSATWQQAFPMVLPPATADGLGVIVLNSNAETHFSFTNALGLVPLAQVRAVDAVAARFPAASWVLAMHHHLVEYPQPAKQLSERIGTGLVDGSWLVRRVQRLAGRAVVMHGHRHIDWIGRCGSLPVVSAPSPVNGRRGRAGDLVYVHSLAGGADGRLALWAPERVALAGQPR